MPYAPQFYTQNITGFPDLLSWANDLSGGVFFPLVIFAMWFIVFLSGLSYYNDTTKAFSLSSVFTLMFTTAFVALTWVPGWYMSIPIIMVGLSGLLIWTNRG